MEADGSGLLLISGSWLCFAKPKLKYLILAVVKTDYV